MTEWLATTNNSAWFAGAFFHYRGVPDGWEAVSETDDGWWRWELHSLVADTAMDGLVAEGVAETREKAIATMMAIRMLTPGILHEQG